MMYGGDEYSQGYGGAYHGAGMGGMGMMAMNMGAPMIMNGTYMFAGPCISFETRAPEVMTDPQAQTIKDINVTLNGNQVTSFGTCCFICTIIWGSILIFPLCFMCCEWWKKRVYPAAVVPISCYVALQNLIRLPQAMSLSLTVSDNGFGQEKINLLYNMLSTSQLRSFRFMNMAQFFDYEDHQYSRFAERMRGFKRLQMVTDIRWLYEVVM